jgi:hypothetical protein
MKKIYLVWLLLVLLVAGLVACGGSEEPTVVSEGETTAVAQTTPTDEPEPTAEPTATDEPEPTSEPEPTAEPTATIEPTPTVEPTPTINQFEEEGIAFLYDPTLEISDITLERLPAQRLNLPEGESPVYFTDVPEFIQLTLNTPQGPSALLIRPIRNEAGQFFSTIPLDLVTYFTAFETQLAEQGAGRTDQQQLSYIDFGSGTGLRAISYLFQENPVIEPITNQNIFYFFDGVTSDGRYYVSLTYPVSTTALPDSAELTPEQESDALADFEGFIISSMAPLSGTVNSDFTPDLTLLDDLLASLKIAPNVSTEVSALANDPNCVNDATFVRDVTIPDATIINPGEPFQKIWEVVNSGTCTWTPAYTATFSDGDDLGWTGFVPVTRVAPGELFQIAVDLQAPQEPGIYEGRWHMINEVGEPFGMKVYVTIVVPEEPIETSP